MEVQTIQKNISQAPRKLRLVADMVRKMRPAQALVALKFSNKRAALPLTKAIQTALANAKQLNQGVGNLQFKKLEINEGVSLKRMRAAGRGRRRFYKKRTSQIKVVLDYKPGGEANGN